MRDGTGHDRKLFQLTAQYRLATLVEARGWTGEAATQGAAALDGSWSAPLAGAASDRRGWAAYAVGLAPHVSRGNAPSTLLCSPTSISDTVVETDHPNRESDLQRGREASRRVLGGRGSELSASKEALTALDERRQFRTSSTIPNVIYESLLPS